MQGRSLDKFTTECHVTRFGNTVNSKILGTEMHQQERHVPDLKPKNTYWASCYKTS